MKNKYKEYYAVNRVITIDEPYYVCECRIYFDQWGMYAGESSLDGVDRIEAKSLHHLKKLLRKRFGKSVRIRRCPTFNEVEWAEDYYWDQVQLGYSS